MIIHQGAGDQEPNHNNDETIPHILAMVPTSEGNKSPISSILSPKGSKTKPSPKKQVPQVAKTPVSPKRASASPKPSSSKPSKVDKQKQVELPKHKAAVAQPKPVKPAPSPPKSSTKLVRLAQVKLLIFHTQNKHTHESARGFRILTQAVDGQQKASKVKFWSLFVSRKDSRPTRQRSASSLQKNASKEQQGRPATKPMGAGAIKPQVPPLQERTGLRNSMLARIDLTPVRAAKQSERTSLSRRPSGVSKRPNEVSLSSRGRSLSPINRKPFVMVERVFARRRRDWVFKFFRLLEKGRIRTYHLAPNQEKFKKNLLATFVSDLLRQQQLKSAFWYIKSIGSPQSTVPDEDDRSLVTRGDGSADESALHTGDRLLVSILKHHGNSRIKASFLWGVFLTYFSKTLQRRLKHQGMESLRARAAQRQQRERFILLFILDAQQKKQMKVGLDAVANYPTNLRNHKLVRFLNVFALHKTINMVQPVFENLAAHAARVRRISLIARTLSQRQEAIRQIEFGCKGVFAKARQSMLEVKLANLVKIY